MRQWKNVIAGFHRVRHGLAWNGWGTCSGSTNSLLKLQCWNPLRLLHIERVRKNQNLHNSSELLKFKFCSIASTKKRPQTILLVFWWENKLCVPTRDQIKSQCTTPQKGQLCREAANCIGINLVRSHRCSPEFPMEMAQCRCNLKQHSLRDRQ